MGIMQMTPGKLSGKVQVPSSKSQAHRAILCAALAQGESTVRPLIASKDMEATIAAVQSLGCMAECQGEVLTLQGGQTEPMCQMPVQLNCGESGSTLRFLIPIAAALGINAVFSGGGRLPERPIGAFLELLPAHGVQCESKGGLPLAITGQLTAGTFTLAGNVSSQYITGLLLALPLLQGDSEIMLTTPLESAAYVDMTLDVMWEFGVTAEKTDIGYSIKGGQHYQARSYQVESDWSQAAFFLCAGALSGDVTVTGLRMDSLQGDKAILSLLKEMGAQIRESENAVQVKQSHLHGIVIDAAQIPDLVPILAVTCAYAQGESVIHGAQRLRIKESDRIASTIAGLHAMGVEVRETADGMVIQGGKLSGGSIDGCNDHRIVMAFAVAALGAEGKTAISDWESIKKSYPDFFEDYKKLGGSANVISMGNKD